MSGCTSTSLFCTIMFTLLLSLNLTTATTNCFCC
jgi:hypothetical protein